MPISLLQILEEGEDRRVDFLGALLLYPVAAAGQDDLLKGGNSLMHAFDPLVHTRDLKAWVLIAPEEEGWLRNVGSTVGGKEFPVAIDIAIPVQATAKAGSRELGGVIVDVCFGEPGWQGRGIAQLFKRVGLGIGQDGMPAFRGSSVARNSVEEAAHGCPDIALKIGFSHPRFLEMQLIKELTFERLLPGLCGSKGGTRSVKGATRNVGGAHRDQSWKEIGAHERSMPGDVSAPVVADQDRLLLPKRIEQANQVTNQVEKRVRGDVRGLIGLTVAAQVGGDDMIASLSQRG